MQKREKILVIVFGVVAAAYGGSWLFESVLHGPFQEREVRLAQLEERIEDRELELDEAYAAIKQLERWQARSLPADPGLARSLYQAWLLEMVQRIGVSGAKVDSGEPVSRKGAYHALSFSVRGRCTLAQITRLLFEFYRADHLHRIRSLSLTPVAGKNQLDVALSIEALSLPGAKQKDRLSSGTSARLASDRLRDYESIVRRNLFGFGGEYIDAVRHTFLTAVVDVDGQSEAWFTVRPDDRTLKLREGAKLDVGLFRGTIEEITGSDVIIASADERWLITIGESLTQASALPPER